MTETKWIKVVRPKKWRAAEGEVLEGIYVGAGDRRSGERTWKEFYVREASGIVYAVSGSVLENLLNVVEIESLVRIVFLGKKPCSTKDWMFNDYDLYVAESVTKTFGAPAPKAQGLWS